MSEDMEARIRDFIHTLDADAFAKLGVSDIAGALGVDNKTIKNNLMVIGLNSLRAPAPEENEDSVEDVLAAYSESIGHTTFTTKEAARATGRAKAELNSAIYNDSRFVQVDTGRAGRYWQWCDAVESSSEDEECMD